jgi:hypothetical protein
VTVSVTVAVTVAVTVTVSVTVSSGEWQEWQGLTALSEGRPTGTLLALRATSVVSNAKSLQASLKVWMLETIFHPPHVVHGDCTMFMTSAERHSQRISKPTRPSVLHAVCKMMLGWLQSHWQLR